MHSGKVACVTDCLSEPVKALTCLLEKLKMMQVSLKAQHRAFQANSSSVTPSSVRHHTLWHKLVQIGLYEQPAFQAKLRFTKLCSTKLRDTKLRYQGPGPIYTVPCTIAKKLAKIGL